MLRSVYWEKWALLLTNFSFDLVLTFNNEISECLNVYWLVWKTVPWDMNCLHLLTTNNVILIVPGFINILKFCLLSTSSFLIQFKFVPRVSKKCLSCFLFCFCFWFLVFYGALHYLMLQMGCHAMLQIFKITFKSPNKHYFWKIARHFLSYVVLP